MRNLMGAYLGCGGQSSGGLGPAVTFSPSKRKVVHPKSSGEQSEMQKDQQFILKFALEREENLLVVENIEEVNSLKNFIGWE